MPLVRVRLRLTGKRSLGWGPLPCTAQSNGQASRALSTARLKASLPLHLPPINVVVSHGPSGELNSQGGFIFGGASHLDAFSGYPFPT